MIYSQRHSLYYLLTSHDNLTVLFYKKIYKEGFIVFIMKNKEGKLVFFIIVNLILSVIAFSFSLSFVSGEMVNAIVDGKVRRVERSTLPNTQEVWPITREGDAQAEAALKLQISGETGVPPATTLVLSGGKAPIKAEIAKTTYTQLQQLKNPITIGGGKKISQIYTKDGLYYYQEADKYIQLDTATLTSALKEQGTDINELKPIEEGAAKDTGIWAPLLGNLGSTGSIVVNMIIQGAIHGAMVYAGLQGILAMFGVDKGIRNAVSAGAAAAVFSGETTYGIVKSLGYEGTTATYWSLGVGIVRK